MARPDLPGKTLRCAVYTRKSSEEGLDQAFNSLEAQRGACEAYIQSQAHEGWRLLTHRYDDGGFSGGTLERPGLQALLAEVRARRVDIIVLYKIDRLTRSLADFARLAELFDAHGVSFVSVTQQFNTTTSMGRLMLNVLLSFAQFEREITGERIRDKIAASKKKGMWMGGFVPLGYDAVDRSLVINAAEAQTVRTLYRLYQEHGTVDRTQAAAEQLGLVSKARAGTGARARGGKPFSRGHLYRILQNPLYVGEIAHRGHRYPGTHPPLIERATWEAVQAQLASQRLKTRRRENAQAPSLLAGLLYAPDGRRYTPTHGTKGGRRYHYYVLKGGPKASRPLPAAQIDPVVRGALGTFLRNTSALKKALGRGPGPGANRGALRAAAWADTLEPLTGPAWRQACDALLQRVVLTEHELRLVVHRQALRAQLGLPVTGDAEDTHDVPVPLDIRRRGIEVRMALPGTDGLTARKPDEALVRMVARARRWAMALAEGKYASVYDLARQEGLNASYVARALPVGLLAPSLVEDILAGRQPANFTLQKLMQGGADLPEDWAGQRASAQHIT